MSIQSKSMIKRNSDSKALIHVGFVFLVFILQIGCSQSQPNIDTRETISWQRKFDDKDRPTELIGPAGRKTLFSYSEDLSGKTIVTKTNDEGDIVELEFDDRGLISSMKDVIGNVNYQYDAFGRLSQVHRTGEPAIKYQYDVEDRITRQSIGDFYTIDYSYDFMGRLSALNTPAGTIHYEYQLGQGQVIRKLPNGVKTIWKFGANGQQLKTTHIDPKNFVLVEFQYQYRADGLIDAIAEKTQKGEKVTLYKYDNVGRIIQVLDQSGSDYKYEYDLLGNRLRATSPDGNDQISEYDWAGRLTSYAGKKCSYDAAGNLSTIHFGASEMNYKFSRDQQLANVNDKVFYKYGGDGKLVERQVDEEKTKFISNPLSDSWQPLVMENHNGGKTVLIWDKNSPLVKITNGRAEYILHDHLGSARLIVDEQGTVKQQLDYSPFGEPKYEVDGNGLTVGFSGLFYDSQAKQYLTKARAYHPGLGQFLQMEPELRPPTGSQKNLSPFAYCGHDPVNFIDADGAWPQFIWEPLIWNPLTWNPQIYAKLAWQIQRIDYVGELTNMYGIGTKWGGKNRSGGAFSREKDIFGEYPLGNPNVLPKNLKDKFYRRHDIQLFVDGHYKKGDLVNVGDREKPEYYVSNGYSSSLFNKPNRQLYLDELGYRDPVIRKVQAFSDYKGFRKLPKGYSESDVKMLDRKNPANWTRDIPSQEYQKNFVRQLGREYGSNSNPPVWQNRWNEFKDIVNIFEVKEAEGAELFHSNVGGVSLTGAAAALDGIGQIEGLTIDANNNLVLISKKGEQRDLPSMRIDDVVTVFRSVYIHGEGPNVTIDPNPNDPEHSAMIIKHGKATENTYVGWVLYHADRLMKGYMLGVDNITTKDVTSKVPGYEDVLNSIYFGDGVLNTSKYEGKWERFWIVPAEVNQFSTKNNDLTLFDVPLKLKTQVMKWQDGELVDDTSGKSSLGARNYTEWFTRNYDAIAEEQYLLPPAGFGIKDSVQVFTELRQIAVITALAEKMRDQGVAMPFWMRDHEVQAVQFEEFTPALLITRTNANVKAQIFGGVSLSANSKAVKQFKTTADLKQLPEEERLKGVQNLKLANTLSTAIHENTSQTTPLQQKIFEIENETYQTMLLPGAETKALSPCRMNEVDLLVPISGGRDIHLSRQFNSFFNPKGIWGQTWTMNLPRLEKINVPIVRATNKVSYQTAYELLTPLNSIYARFSKVETVPILNTKLQVPDSECAFFGLANSTPSFLNVATLELISKTGESLHFTEYGDLIATEKDGFRIVYLRNETGNVKQIVGLLGRTRMASIDLIYDHSNKLISAAGENEFGEQQAITYEYNSSGNLSEVISAQGKLIYKYQNSRVSEAGWLGSEDSDVDPNRDKKILRRFIYNNSGQLIAEHDDHEKRVEYTVTANQGETTLEINRDEADPGASSISYDASFRLLDIRYNDGALARHRYPPTGGSSIEYIDPDGKKTHITESFDRTKRTVESNNQPTVTELYDQMGRLTKLNVGAKNLFHQQWSPTGNLQAIQTENSIIRPRYDVNGLTESITVFSPGSGKKLKKWETINLDLTGRPVKIKDYSGLHIDIQYDTKGAVSQFITKRDGKNYGYEFSRNENGQIETVKSSWGKEQFTYDPAGVLSKLVINKAGFKNEEQATIEFKSGRVHKVAQFDGSQMEISYDNDGLSSGLLSQIKCSNGLELNYRYNSSGDLEKVTVGNERQVHLNYDDKGRIIGYSFCKN